MNLIGKIFTFLIFFLSIFFLIVAVLVGQNHHRWKAEAAKLKSQADTADRRLQEAKTGSTEMQSQINQERVSRQQQLAFLESQLAQLKAKNQATLIEVNGLKETNGRQLTKMEQAEARVEQQDAELAELKAKNIRLVDDIANQFHLTRTLTNETFELKNTIALLKEKQGDYVGKLADLKKIMRYNGLDETEPLGGLPEPLIEGLVRRVGENNLFAIDLGTDDGIRVGHSVDIHRGGQFIGKAQVVKVDHDVAVLKSDENFMKDHVREGDNVTTKF